MMMLLVSRGGWQRHSRCTVGSVSIGSVCAPFFFKHGWIRDTTGYDPWWEQGDVVIVSVVIIIFILLVVVVGSFGSPVGVIVIVVIGDAVVAVVGICLTLLFDPPFSNDGGPPAVLFALLLLLLSLGCDGRCRRGLSRHWILTHDNGRSRRRHVFCHGCGRRCGRL